MKRTTAPGNVSNMYVDRNIQQGTAGTTLMAEDRNNIQEEICHPIETSGFTLDGDDDHQLEKAIIALSRSVGELILTDTELTPKEYAGSTGADYCPVIPRHDADHDIDDSVVPQAIIDSLNATKWNIKGVEDFSCTVSGSSVVVENTAAGNALISAVIEQGMINRWYNTGGASNYRDYGALYSGKRAFCLTIASVNYEITGANATNHTLTVGEAPGDGVKTMSIHPHRIGGVTNKSRLRKISGEALQAANEVASNLPVASHDEGSVPNATGYVNSFHQNIPGPSGAFYAGGRINEFQADWSNSGGGYGVYMALRNSNNLFGRIALPKPHSYSVYVYTHLRYLLSTNWTSN